MGGGTGLTFNGSANSFGQGATDDSAQNGSGLQLGGGLTSNGVSNPLGQNLMDSMPQFTLPQAAPSYGLTSGTGTGQGLTTNGGIGLSYQGVSVQGSLSDSAPSASANSSAETDNQSLINANNLATMPNYYGNSVAGQSYVAARGDSISSILGTSDPQAVGNFMRANGLTNSNIVAGNNYFVPDSTDAYGNSSGLGQNTLNADNARIAQQQALAAQNAAQAAAGGAGTNPFALSASDLGYVGKLSGYLSNPNLSASTGGSLTPQASALIPASTFTTLPISGSDSTDVRGGPSSFNIGTTSSTSSPVLGAVQGVGDAIGSRVMGVVSLVNDSLWQVGNVASGGLLAQYSSDAQAALVRQQVRGDAMFNSLQNLSTTAGQFVVDPVGTVGRGIDAVSNEAGKISTAYSKGDYRTAFGMAAGDIIDTALTVAPVIGPAARVLDAAAELGLQGASLAVGDFAASRTGQLLATNTEQYMARSGLLATAVPLGSGTIGGIVDATESIGNSEVKLSATQLRNTPGVATVSTELTSASGRWLDASVPTPIPAQVGDALAGQSFNTFGDLRQAIWEQIGSNPELNSGFSRANLAKMNDGLAASAPADWLTETGAFGDSFNIHHANPIEFGGAVYDLSNLQIVSPKVHFDIHYGPN